MRAKTVGYIVAALAPFWLLALLAIHGRFFVSPYEEFEYGNKASEIILNYGSVVRYTAEREYQLSILDSNTIDSVANKWIELHREGKLNEVPQISPEDDGSFGFRSEIEYYKRMVLTSLQRDLQKSRDENNYSAAGNRLAQILEVANIAKYNSCLATTNSSSAQMYALEAYDELNTKLEYKQRLHVFTAISNLRADPNLVRHTAERMSIASKNVISEDAVQFPDKAKMTLILNDEKSELDVGVDCNPQGYLLAESFRVAHKQELALSERLDRYRLTALKTN